MYHKFPLQSVHSNQSEKQQAQTPANQKARPNTLTMQYMVLFSHRTVQLPETDIHNPVEKCQQKCDFIINVRDDKISIFSIQYFIISNIKNVIHITYLSEYWLPQVARYRCYVYVVLKITYKYMITAASDINLFHIFCTKKITHQKCKRIHLKYRIMKHEL